MASSIGFFSCDRTRPCAADPSAGYDDQVQKTMGDASSADPAVLSSEDIGGVAEQADEGASNVDGSFNSTILSLGDAFKKNKEELDVSKATTSVFNSWNQFDGRSHLFTNQQNRSRRRRTSPTLATLV